MTAYWISIYREIRDEAKVAAYAELAGPALRGAGGTFVARGLPEQTYEAGERPAPCSSSSTRSRPPGPRTRARRTRRRSPRSTVARCATCGSCPAWAERVGTTRIYVDMVGDLFHAGHVSLLREARRHGDWLVVGVLSDDTAASYKRRPIMTLPERVAVIEACRYVDEVIADAPFRVTAQFLAAHDIATVVHGDDLSPAGSDAGAYRTAGQMGASVRFTRRAGSRPDRGDPAGARPDHARVSPGSRRGPARHAWCPGTQEPLEPRRRAATSSAYAGSAKRLVRSYGASA